MIKLVSNIDSVINNITAKLADACLPGGNLYDVSMRAAASDTLAKMTIRIHVDGKASDDSEIGTYSNKRLYVNPNNSPRKFSGGNTGKTGRSIFESTGQPHATKYFDEGYSGFRAEVGRQSDKVNLSLTGGLEKALQALPIQGGWGIGFDNDECYMRSVALEKKYGKRIWSLSGNERLNFIEVFQTQIANGFSGSTN
jgi:hypothetical protein